VSSQDRLRELYRDPRVVIIGLGSGPDENDRVTRRGEVLGDHGLEALPRVVRGDSDLQATLASA
jgi:hypothetical protein